MDKEKLNAANELMALIYDREQAVSNITNSLNREHKLIHFRSSKSSAEFTEHVFALCKDPSGNQKLLEVILRELQRQLDDYKFQFEGL